jgi:alanyl-tRNA synthetase
VRDKEKQYKRNAEWAKKNKPKRAVIESRYYRSLCPLVYRWVSPSKKFTAYVGRGTMRRAMQHRNSPWYEPDMVVKVLRARNEWHSMHLEGLWGELFRPRYNKDGYRK